MKKVSAGLVMYKKEGSDISVFLVHPGGPFFKNKDNGVWSIPKGEPEESEVDLLAVACREFEEETGIASMPPYIDLGYIIQKNRKQVFAWAFKGNWSGSKPIISNTFLLEWPPKSGKKIEIPEVDKGEWFLLPQAIQKIIPEQYALIDRLITELNK